MRWYGLNRTYCDCCSEMRAILDNTNACLIENRGPMLRSLVEELQVYGNRMEAALEDLRDMEELHKDIKKKKKELKELKKQVNKLKDDNED